MESVPGSAFLTAARRDMQDAADRAISVPEKLKKLQMAIDAEMDSLEAQRDELETSVKMVLAFLTEIEKDGRALSADAKELIRRVREEFSFIM